MPVHDPEWVDHLGVSANGIAMFEVRGTSSAVPTG